MIQLISPRPACLTTAAVLALVTGCYWLGFVGLFLFDGPDLSLTQAYGWIVAVGILGITAVVSGVGLLSRQNWARILGICLAGLWVLFGWNLLRPILWLPDSLNPGLFPIAVFGFPIVSGFVYLTLVVRKGLRLELLPPAIVQIYVKLLDKGSSSSRVTQASAVGNGLFELLAIGEYNPEHEHWEFPPGSIVRGVESQREDGKHCLLAVSIGS